MPSGAVCGSRGLHLPPQELELLLGTVLAADMLEVLLPVAHSASQHRAAVQIYISSKANLATCTMDQTLFMPLEPHYMISMMPHVSPVGS